VVTVVIIVRKQNLMPCNIEIIKTTVKTIDPLLQDTLTWHFIPGLNKVTIKNHWVT
jgi:hypothetical protein